MMQLTIKGFVGAEPETKDIDAKHEGGEKAQVAVFSVACHQGKSTTWVDVNLWEAMIAEAARVHKGALVQVSGRMRVSAYNSRGQARARITVDASSVMVIPREALDLQPGEPDHDDAYDLDMAAAKEAASK